MKTLIRYILCVCFAALSSFSYAQQIRIPNFSGSITNIPGISAFIDASSYPLYNNLTNNIGKGLLFPRVDLTALSALNTGSGPVGDVSNFPSYYDGMIVYNTATSGVAGVGATQGGVLTAGFWYYDNKSSTLNGGTWKQLGSGVSNNSGSSITASNGLTANGSDVQLGGTLTKNTTDTLSTYNLLFLGTGTAGKVAVGAAVPGTASARFEVDGASANVTAYNAVSSTVIDFSKSNLAYTSASAGAFTLNNLKDGATYTLAVQGTTSGKSTFSATNTANSSVTCKILNDRATVSGSQTLYTIIVMGTTAYIYIASGF